MPLTKYVSAVTILTADVANSWYGGLFGDPAADELPADHPLVAGHVHDGQRIDGHAQRISLADHVTDELDGSMIQDGTISLDKLAFPVTNTLVIEDQGVVLPGGPFDTLDFVGAAITATNAGGGTATITVSGGGGGSEIIIEDEGVAIAGGPFDTLDFVGASVTATDAGGGTATITIVDSGSDIGGLTITRLSRTVSAGGTFNLEDASTTPGVVINNPNAGSNSQIAYFKARVTCYAEPAPAVDDTACWTIEGCVLRDRTTDTLSLPVAPVVTPLFNTNGVDWDVTAVADNASKQLRIQVTIDGFGLGPGAAPNATFYADLEISPAGV